VARGWVLLGNLKTDPLGRRHCESKIIADASGYAEREVGNWDRTV
jgi:hypothetical protein